MHKRVIYWVFLVGVFLITRQANASIDHQKMKNNEISITALGKGGWWSVDYTRKIWGHKLIRLDGVVSFSSYYIKDYENRFNPNMIVPIGLRGQYGKKHSLLLDIGLSFQRLIVFDKRKITKFAIDPFVGLHYRRRFLKSFFVQGGVYLLKIKQQKVYIWPGLSLGLMF